MNKDPYKVLKKLHPDTIASYLNMYYGYRVVEEEFSKRNYNYDYIAEDLWHGDFDLKKFLDAIGSDGVQKIKKVLNS